MRDVGKLTGITSVNFGEYGVDKTVQSHEADRVYDHSQVADGLGNSLFSGCDCFLRFFIVRPELFFNFLLGLIDNRVHRPLDHQGDYKKDNTSDKVDSVCNQVNRGFAEVIFFSFCTVNSCFEIDDSLPDRENSEYD